MQGSRRASLAVVGAAALVLTHSAPVSAVPVTVLDLQLNEAAGVRTTLDSSGQGHHGVIGSHPVMNGEYATFDHHPESQRIAYRDAHLIVVPDAGDGSLDPGAGNFSVEVRFRTLLVGDETPNLLQKGQSGASGGQVKLQLARGRLSCTFKTPQGTATATSSTSVADGAWHVVRCDRTPTSVTVFVDGARSGARTATTGTLNNNKPWVVGGKQQCDARNVDCDYFAGAVDYLRLTKG
jgi:hypothetical protein